MDLSDPRVQAAIIAAFVSFLAAVATYIAAKDKIISELEIADRRTKSDLAMLSMQLHEANKRPFLEKQLEFCVEAVNATATLAVEGNLEEREKARWNFFIYFGAG